MKIGVIVDGDAEQQALQSFFSKIGLGNTQLIGPYYANMQPKASPLQICRSSLSKLEILVGSYKTDQNIVLIDLEDREECPGMFAKMIEEAYTQLGYKVSVVVKNICLKNWLIADPYALKVMGSRFNIEESFLKKVSPNKADRVKNPLHELNKICIKKDYHKRKDALQIAKKLNPETVAANSRSFRRFLRLVGHAKYLSQSIKPAIG